MNLEKLRELEAKVGKSLEFLHLMSEENAALKRRVEERERRIAELESEGQAAREDAERRLQERDQRIAELEAQVQVYKEEQGHVEAGILSALDKLNKFEDTMEQDLTALVSDRGPEGGQSGEGSSDMRLDVAASQGQNNVELEV